MNAPGSGPAPHDPWQQAPYGQAPYGQAPYAYDAPPPVPGTAYPPPGYAPGYPAAGAYPPAGGAWGAPPGVVVIPGGPVLQAASPGQRTLARLIDSAGYLVLMAGAAVLGIVLLTRSVDDSTRIDDGYGYARTTSDGFPLGVLWFYALLALGALIIIGYESLMIGLTGSTVGGRLMGVRFVRTTDGAVPGFGRALGRAALLGASTVVCNGLVFLLLLLSMFFDGNTGRYQSWIDKLCGLQAVTTRT